LLQPGGNLEQDGFAGTVAPDQQTRSPGAIASSAPKSMGVTPNEIRVLQQKQGRGMVKEISGE
jgi:hypothetical protein